MRAVQITEFGGPEVLTLTELPDPVADDGEILLEVSSAGVNYADTHTTENSYLAQQQLPLVPGGEVVGRGQDGTRYLAYCPSGGYAEKAAVPRATAVPLPAGVTDGQALALLVQGLTAWHLLRTSTHLAAGESVVVHAAAGGVGTLAVQLAKAWGAGRVIGLASSDDKRALATRMGADAVVDSGAPDLNAALREANGGKPVDIVLEMVGGATTDASLKALAPFGRLAVFGMASREAPKPIQAGALMGTSKAVIGFWLAHCFGRPEMMGPPMAELLAMVASGSLEVTVGGTYPLGEVARAHEALLSRSTMGKLILDCTV